MHGIISLVVKGRNVTKGKWESPTFFRFGLVKVVYLSQEAQGAVKNDFMVAINQVCHERQLPTDIVLEAVEVALISAYKRNFSANHVTAQIDPKTGEPQIFVEKAVVDQVEDDKNEITLKAAKAINPRVEVGGLVSVESTPSNFGRIAAQTAKQVILQRIREAERDALYSSYVEREGEIVNGTVHKIDAHQVTLSLGKVEAYLPRGEQIPTEHYSEGQRLRAYVSSVTKGSRGPQITLSRTHRNMLRRLLEVEVPEIYNGTVEIKSIAREAGYRSKVAVAALQEGVDPVGSCVGMRGTRIQNIVNELNGEKIDVVQWNPDLSYFIANSLSPAKVMNVMFDDQTNKTAVVVVPDKQLSLAIGKEGQNARLAAKLTNWRIDIKSASEAIQETLNEIKTNEALRARVADRMEFFNTSAAIVADKQPIEYSDGELSVFSKAIEAVNLARMALERERRANEIEARKSGEPRDLLSEAEAILSGQIPRPGGPAAKVSVEELELAPAEELDLLADVGDLVTAAEALLAETPVEETSAVETAIEAKAEVEVAPAVEAVVELPPTVKVQPAIQSPIEAGTVVTEEWEEGELDQAEKKGKKKDKKRRLVYDDRLGQVVAERRRKQRGRPDWTEFGSDDE
jgi:transcription termination/antitermination protein NusA